MATAPTPILDLDTLTPPPSVRIDGHDYVLKVLDGLTLLEHNRLQQVQPRLSVLLDLAVPSEGELRELAVLLDAVCRLVLEAPDEVQRRLNDPQRMAVVLAFFGLLPRLGRLTRAVTGLPETPPPSTGGKPSRGSSRSTGARR